MGGVCAYFILIRLALSDGVPIELVPLDRTLLRRVGAFAVAHYAHPLTEKEYQELPDFFNLNSPTLSLACRNAQIEFPRQEG